MMLEDMHHNMHTNLIPSSALGLEMMMKKSRMGKSMMRKSMMKNSMKKFTPCSGKNFIPCVRPVEEPPLGTRGWNFSTCTRNEFLTSIFPSNHHYKTTTTPSNTKFPAEKGITLLCIWSQQQHQKIPTYTYYYSYLTIYYLPQLCNFTKILLEKLINFYYYFF